jgi:hypothetical protein
MGIEEITVPHFFKKPGEHCLVGGLTGSGKTQVLYYILENLIHYNPRETIVWFDTGKSAELLRLSDFRPLKLFVPQGKEADRDIVVYQSEGETVDYEVMKFKETRDLFDYLDPNKINVMCFEPFFQDDPGELTKALNEFFKDLFRLAMEDQLKIPLAIFVDEVHSVAPSQGMAFDDEHMKAAVRFQRNIERLRSAGVRIIGTIQDWTKLRRGVRTSFQWIVIKRGMTFTDRDLPQLAKYNEKWWKIKTEDSVWVFPDRSYFSKYVGIPFYGDGKKKGKVRYIEVAKQPLPDQHIPLPSLSSRAAHVPSTMPG